MEDIEQFVTNVKIASYIIGYLKGEQTLKHSYMLPLERLLT